MSWIVAAIVYFGLVLVGAAALLLLAAAGKRDKTTMQPSLANRETERTHPAEWEADADE